MVQRLQMTNPYESPEFPSNTPEDKPRSYFAELMNVFIRVWPGELWPYVIAFAIIAVINIIIPLLTKLRF